MFETGTAQLQSKLHIHCKVKKEQSQLVSVGIPTVGLEFDEYIHLYVSNTNRYQGFRKQKEKLADIIIGK